MATKDNRTEMSEQVVKCLSLEESVLKMLNAQTIIWHLLHYAPPDYVELYTTQTCSSYYMNMVRDPLKYSFPGYQIDIQPITNSPMTYRLILGKQIHKYRFPL